MILKTPNTVVVIGPGVVLHQAGVNLELMPGRVIVASCETTGQAALLLETIATYAAQGETYLAVNEKGQTTRILSPRVTHAEDVDDPQRWPLTNLAAVVSEMAYHTLGQLGLVHDPDVSLKGNEPIGDVDDESLDLGWLLEIDRTKPAGKRVTVTTALFLRGEDGVRVVAGPRQGVAAYTVTAWHVSLARLLGELRERSDEQQIKGLEAAAKEMLA